MAGHRIGDADTPSFIGQGFAFPMRVDADGSIALEGGHADVEKAMRVILSTAIGERPMRPAFGCGIWDLLFEPINANTLGLMEDAVREALARWEPRARIDGVSVTPDPKEGGAVLIDVAYTVRSTNDPRNLVHPFYLIPGDDEEGHQ
ncbi:GPW/gp25 family protein [Nitriliruptor alkaliphilus]|uniref:GPW/gp25 family protein n=1 Tax=Nitriliruptor alkaliphilus TaxID=427918 RepID=UPI000698F648|nr:GPW/gp25 family protein [Nitriliruptor alkaliphilus]